MLQDHFQNKSAAGRPCTNERLAHSRHHCWAPRALVSHEEILQQFPNPPRTAEARRYPYMMWEPFRGHKTKISHAALQFSQHLILSRLVQYLPSSCFKFIWFICFQFLSCFALLKNRTEQDKPVSVPDIGLIRRRSLSAFCPSCCKRLGEGSCFILIGSG